MDIIEGQDMIIFINFTARDTTLNNFTKYATFHEIIPPYIDVENSKMFIFAEI